MTASIPCRKRKAQPNSDKGKSEMDTLNIVNVVIQAIIGAATVAAVVVALRQTHLSKKVHEEEIRRHQSTRISSWYEAAADTNSHPTDKRFVWRSVALRNESESPVYNVIITCVGFQGAGPFHNGEDNEGGYPCRRCIGTLPPGLWFAWLPTGGSGMHVVTATEIAFTDANGLSWVRRGNGKLEEIKSDPASFYNLPLPIEWAGCVRAS